MKRGLPEEALYMLKNEYKKYEMSEPESAYFMNMVLVEILISQVFSLHRLMQVVIHIGFRSWN